MEIPSEKALRNVAILARGAGLQGLVSDPAMSPMQLAEVCADLGAFVAWVEAQAAEKKAE